MSFLLSFFHLLFFPRSLLQNSSHARYSSKCKKARSIPMCLGFQGLSIQLRSNLSTSAVAKLILFHWRNKTAKRTAWMIFRRAGSLTDSHHFPPAHLEQIYLKSQTLLLFSLTLQRPMSFQYLIDPCEPPPFIDLASLSEKMLFHLPKSWAQPSVYYLTAIRSR